MKVFDLKKLMQEAGLTGDNTIAQAITKLQTGLAFDCPKCDTFGGFVPENSEDGQKIECDICLGEGKTAEQYEAYTLTTGYRVKDTGDGGGGIEHE